MPAVATLIDAGPIVASLNARDPDHVACKEAFAKLGPFVYTCWPVITEAVYLLGNYSVATAKLFELLRMRTYRLLPLVHSDLQAIEAVLAKYQDQNFQLADACLMHLAERESIAEVLTLDKRDFSIFRNSSGKMLTILP
jgi:uncharacterized protein